MASDDRVLRVEDMERLSPDERHRLVNEPVVTDLSKVDPGFFERARAKGRALLEQRGAIPASGDAG